MTPSNAPLPYRKSSFCHETGCVEVAAFRDNYSVALRDSKNPHLPPHIFTAHEWDAFLSGAKAGEFDRTTLGSI